MSKFDTLNRLMRYLREVDQDRPPNPRIMQRAEAMQRDSPDALRPFSPGALHQMLRGENPVVLINPADFEGGLAYPFPEKYMYPEGPRRESSEARKAFSVLDDYIKELGMIAQDQGWSDVPALNMRAGYVPGEDAGMDLPGLFVEGHEGRHRSRALERLGFPEMPVNLSADKGLPLDRVLPRERGETKVQQLKRLLDERSAVVGEDSEKGYWSGGTDFPFLRWYRRGGMVNGAAFGD